ncbi:GH3 auxin-responsive promoter family protein [bacterium]|nr:GH3 auxin-responsive promoter family protein [bacterium]
MIGDVIKFTSIKPRRIQVAGRTKYFIDMLGERVYLEHVEKAILQTSKLTNTVITDYTV